GGGLGPGTAGVARSAAAVVGPGVQPAAGLEPGRPPPGRLQLGPDRQRLGRPRARPRRQGGPPPPGRGPGRRGAPAPAPGRGGAERVVRGRFSPQMPERSGAGRAGGALTLYPQGSAGSNRLASPIRAQTGRGSNVIRAASAFRPPPRHQGGSLVPRTAV